jgi:uncharacterized protein YbgA (DUF1722 family)/uncharacterized protein YbbK (DUF523 family)
MSDDEQHLRIKLGVSACLMGKEVRFDGGHKRNAYIVNSLQEHADLVPVCPEVEIGLGTPRSAIQLRKVDSEIRLVVSKSIETDLTARMQEYSAHKTDALSDLDGFIFKKDSPSCGVFRVPVVQTATGQKTRDGIGIFANLFNKQFPLIPVEDEGRLNDPMLRENFFERVYSYRRWKEMLATNNSVHGLILFHSRHKLLLMARGSSYYSKLGRIVAGTTGKTLSVNQQKYIWLFMEVLSKTTCRGQQVNVMQHVLGHLKSMLSKGDKRELLSIFEAYRQRQMPLITPITILRHYIRYNKQAFIREQYYFDPYPESLALRSWN